MKRRILATLLSLCLLVGLMPTVALATPGELEMSSGFATENNEIISNVIAPLAGSQTISVDTTWSEPQTLTSNLVVNSGVTLTIGAKVTISGNVTISGGGTIKRGDSYEDALLFVPEGAELTLQNITIDGGAVWSEDTPSGLAADEAAIRIEGGAVNLNDGAVVQNNNHTSINDNSYNHTIYDEIYDLPRYYNMGGGIAVYGGTLTMNEGATIKNNAVTNTGYQKVITGTNRTGNSDSLGGGVGIYENGTFIMNGGEITGNHAAVSDGEGRAFGGGVGLMTRGANAQVTSTPDDLKITFTMNGGIISENSAANSGGGVYGGVDQGDIDADKYRHLEMVIAGEISNNTSEQTGGGLQVGNADLKIQAGAKILSNEAKTTGGGIQVGSYSHFSMSGGLVSGNNATDVGGGIYFNTNKASPLNITGGEIMNNSAGNSGGGIQIGTELTVTISDCMISGNTCGVDGGSTVANGGGIQANLGVVLTLTNCTITENESKTGHGGGLYVSGLRNGAGSTKFSGTVIIDGNSSKLSGPNTYTNMISSLTTFYNLDTSSKMGMTWNVNDVDQDGTAVISGVTEDNYSCIMYETDGNYVMRKGDNDTAVLKPAIVITLYFNDPTIDDHTGEERAYFLTLANEQVFPEDLSAACQFTKEGYLLSGWGYNRIGQQTEDDNYRVEFPCTFEKSTGIFALWTKLTDVEDISMEYGSTYTVSGNENGIAYTDWKSSNETVATVNDGIVTAVGVGTADISFTASTTDGGSIVRKFTVTVTPRVLTYALAGESTGSGSITYHYSGGHHALSESLTFIWADDPSTEVTLVEGADINYTYTVTDPEAPDGGTELTYGYLPMPVGTYNKVKFNLLNKNYTFALADGNTRNYLEITVNVVSEGSGRAYLASAWPKADQNFVYIGEGVLPVEGILNAYAENNTSSAPVDIGTFTINIEGLNDTSFRSEVSGIPAGTDLSAISGLPTEPGTYIITASAANDSYYLYKSLVFTISKATVTVKADDKTIYVGDNLPEWTYTVSGLASGESLTTLPTFTCSTTDTNTAGTYTITPSGAAVPNTDRYNDAITYQTGTLTILNRSGGSSSSGGSGSSSSSSSNVSGSGDDVSISASGGSVTASQMESAVNKADEGSAITIKATSSTTVTLPVGGMEDAADNDNDVLLDLRYGEITLSARAIAGMTEGVSSSDKIKVSVANQTSSKDAAISDLLDKGAAVFDVTVEVDGVEIHSFDGTLTITLTVSNLSKISDPHVLHILTNGTKEYYAPDRISGNTIMVKGVRNLSTFAVIPGSEVPQTNPFTDVTTSDYYYDAVLWAVANGVTNGSTATTFSPNTAVSRAQMVTFLWRAHGSPKATGANPFTDVSTSDYYYDAVLWAVANGVTNGTSATTFSPDASVTRAQAVTFQWRTAGSPVVSGSSFGDVVADAYYVNAVTWAVANGITNGTSATTFSPDVVVSRAQAVTFLYRELG